MKRSLSTPHTSNKRTSTAKGDVNSQQRGGDVAVTVAAANLRKAEAQQQVPPAQTQEQAQQRLQHHQATDQTTAEVIELSSDEEADATATANGRSFSARIAPDCKDSNIDLYFDADCGQQAADAFSKLSPTDRQTKVEQALIQLDEKNTLWVRRQGAENIYSRFGGLLQLMDTFEQVLIQAVSAKKAAAVELDATIWETFAFKALENVDFAVMMRVAVAAASESLVKTIEGVAFAGTSRAALLSIDADFVGPLALRRLGNDDSISDDIINAGAKIMCSRLQYSGVDVSPTTPLPTVIGSAATATGKLEGNKKDAAITQQLNNLDSTRIHRLLPLGEPQLKRNASESKTDRSSRDPYLQRVLHTLASIQHPLLIIMNETEYHWLLAEVVREPGEGDCRTVRMYDSLGNNTRRNSRDRRRDAKLEGHATSVRNLIDGVIRNGAPERSAVQWQSTEFVQCEEQPATNECGCRVLAFLAQRFRGLPVAHNVAMLLEQLQGQAQRRYDSQDLLRSEVFRLLAGAAAFGFTVESVKGSSDV